MLLVSCVIRRFRLQRWSYVVPDKDAVASDSLYTDEEDKQMTEDEETFLNSLPLSTSDDIWPSRTSVSSSSSEAVDDRILAQLRYIPRYIA